MLGLHNLQEKMEIVFLNFFDYDPDYDSDPDNDSDYRTSYDSDYHPDDSDYLPDSDYDPDSDPADSDYYSGYYPNSMNKADNPDDSVNSVNPPIDSVDSAQIDSVKSQKNQIPAGFIKNGATPEQGIKLGKLCCQIEKKNAQLKIRFNPEQFVNKALKKNQHITTADEELTIKLEIGRTLGFKV